MIRRGAGRRPQGQRPGVPHASFPRAGKQSKKRGRGLLFVVTVMVVLVYWRLENQPRMEGYVENVDGNKQIFLNIPEHNAAELVHSDTFVVSSAKLSSNITVLCRGQTNYRENAIVILAQKKHATYDRDSYGLLIKSLRLLAKNYLSLHDHAENVDIFLFHTGDFDYRDIEALENLLEFRTGILKLVNLDGTAFWTLPPWHKKDNQSHWAVSDIFPIGYRHMCRWFGVNIWYFFEQMNSQLSTSYRFLLRIDEDSFILSPIDYDIFNYMKGNEFVYGYRMCAYEMDYNRFVAPWFNKWKRKTPMKREITRDLCGLYNNFFVADLDFFVSDPVRKYLKEIDRQGFIYRKRYGDLMIHSTAVYAFADPGNIHRFLDFTYQHVTTDHILNPGQGCVVWGGIQAGYKDKGAEQTLKSYVKEYVLDKNCTANITFIMQEDLSPTYQHLPDDWKSRVRLKTIAAGKVELPLQGLLSG